MMIVVNSWPFIYFRSSKCSSRSNGNRGNWFQRFPQVENSWDGWWKEDHSVHHWTSGPVQVDLHARGHNRIMRL